MKQKNYDDLVKRLLRGNRVSKSFIKSYLNNALATGEKRDFHIALGDVIRAEPGGVAGFCEKNGIARRVVHRTISEKSNPTILTVNKIFKGLGLAMGVSAIER